MNKEILAENFINASKQYSELSNAMQDRYKDDPILACLIRNLNSRAHEYYMSIMRIYDAGLTVDEVLKLDQN